MKKFLLGLAMVGLGTAANAQQCDEFPTPTTSKYSVATNSFWSNWYIQVGVDAAVINAQGPTFSEEWHGFRNYGLNLAVGKWFTPGVGSRLKVNWNGFAFRKDHDGVKHALYSNDGKNNYGAIYYDQMFNLSNLFCGYNEKRVWNVSVFPRMGVVRDFSYNYWSAALGVGLQSSWRLSKRTNIFLEGAYTFCSGEWMNRNTGAVDIEKSNFGKTGILSLDLGVTVNLGKVGWSKAVSLEDYEALSNEACAKLTALRQQLKDSQDECARLREELAKKPKEVRVVEQSNITAPATSVFFNLNSSKINSKKDIINLEAIATAAKNSNAKVVVTGAADSKTGSSSYNQKLSESRAKAVADALVNLGVSRDKIETRAQGGVSDVSPYKLNRRAIIEIK